MRTQSREEYRTSETLRSSLPLHFLAHQSKGFVNGRGDMPITLFDTWSKTCRASAYPGRPGKLTGAFFCMPALSEAVSSTREIVLVFVCCAVKTDVPEAAEETTGMDAFPPEFPVLI
jgi:hypothetical protein